MQDERINVRHQRASAKVLTGDYLRLSSYKLIEELFGLLQIGRIEASMNKLWTASEKDARCPAKHTLVSMSRMRHAEERYAFIPARLLQSNSTP